MRFRSPRGRSIWLALCILAALPLRVDGNEGGGFHGIRWGANLAEVPDLTLTESASRVQTYEHKHGPPRLGEAELEMMRFVAIDGRFARVSIRYAGEENHARLLAFLQARFGPIEREPGSMLRGLNQQFTWRTADTMVNLTYRSDRERGDLFIESRTFAPRFMDILPEHAF